MAESTRKKALLKLEKLDTDLKNYKGTPLKRDQVSVYLQNWSHVLSYVNKAESTPEIAEQRGERDSQNQAVLTKLKCAAGLAELASRKYKPAAKCFLQASFDHCDCPELLSPSNVAVYGACVLWPHLTDRSSNVMSSQAGRITDSFKLFLELEPQIRDIIFKFYESKYASCLKLLDEMKDNLLLDMYLAPHVKTLYSQIRNRALIQYFSPYVSADMTKMAQAFNTTVAALEDELTQLILEGLINARIDSHSKILYARDVDQRSTTFEKSLHMGKEFQRRAKAMILRAAVLRNQIHVKVNHCVFRSSSQVLLRFFIPAALQCSIYKVVDSLPGQDVTVITGLDSVNKHKL
ncbi:hypothetical protein INR49_018432 [Caranx melampygus]|nr:hypothetical protein INR49_018432 [Caranx melampygus]